MTRSLRFSFALLFLPFFLTAVSAYADEDLKAKVHIKNNSGHRLKLATVNLSWGKMEVLPPEIIEIGQQIWFEASGRCGSSAGTEGTVIYDIEGTKEQVSFGWDVPWGIGKVNRSNLNGSENFDILTHCSGEPTDCGGDASMMILRTIVAPR